MSALGHKRTFCDGRAMSALPPIADIGRDALEDGTRWNRLKMNRPPIEAAYLYLTTVVKIALLFAVLEVGHRFQLVLRCVEHRVIRIVAISIFRL